MGGFFIYKSGRWVELDIEAGLLEGQKVKFARVNRGKLELARRRKVLRGLRALDAGNPGSVSLGSRLTCRRREHHKHGSKYRVRHCGPHCCSHACHQPFVSIQQNSNVQFNKCETPSNIPEKTEKKPEQPIVSTDNKTNRRQSQSPCKELFIDFEDVEYIKKSLAENPSIVNGFDPYQFENNQVYCNRILYILNPIVKLTRSRNVDRMSLKFYEENNSLTLKKFAAELGLTHIDDKTAQAQPMYRTRQKDNKRAFYDDNKENTESMPERKKTKYKESTSEDKTDVDSDEILSIAKKRISKTPQNKPERNNAVSPTRVLRERESDKDINKGPKERKNLSEDNKKKCVNKKCGLPKDVMVKLARTKSKAGPKMNPREYSSLEDHAIVAWVSVGGRERQVNGNRLWRELQTQYREITGQQRSWHSLRNRYLRYILPALPRLRLTADHESKLRAAAVKGQIKLARKKCLQRRNSMFETTVVQSAWAKRSDNQVRPQTRATTLSPGELNNEKNTSIGRSLRDRLAPRRETDKPETSLKTLFIKKKHVTSSSDNLKSDGKKNKTRKSIDQVLIEENIGGIKDRPLRSRASLTYSSITRAFNDAHLHKRHSSSLSTSPTNPASPEPAAKRRRLFNPNLLKP